MSSSLEYFSTRASIFAVKCKDTNKPIKKEHTYVNISPQVRKNLNASAKKI